MDQTIHDAQAQADARQYFYENQPETFQAISAKDRKQKLAFRQVIETNWQCDVQNSIPLHIMPHHKENARVKGRIGEPGEEAPWWTWSIYILAKLARLARLTKGKMDDAHQMLLKEVRDRQRDMTNRQRDIAELLPSDLDVVNNFLIKQYMDEHGADEDIKKIKQEPTDEDTYTAATEQDKDDDDVEAVPKAVKVKRDVHEEPPVTAKKLPVTTTQPTKRQKIEHTNDMAGVATLRARASRYKQEGYRLEAEAYELEAKLLSGK